MFICLLMMFNPRYLGQGRRERIAGRSAHKPSCQADFTGSFYYSNVIRTIKYFAGPASVSRKEKEENLVRGSR